MKKLAWLVAMVCLGTSLLAAVQRDEAKVADVMAGKLTEAHLVWWGFNENDSTDIIKAAIESPVKKLIVDKMPSPWITLPIMMKSDFELVFEDGAEILAKKGEFVSKGASLISMPGLKNISIVGLGERGGILRMHKTDYQNPPYEKAEWRHCVQMHSSSNITIRNMSMLESGGDGIYIGAQRGNSQRYCKDITISKCICDKNHRQGISVIGAVNLLIEDTRMTNTSGTPPQAGIDFEPNGADEPLVNCVMRNCYSEGNAGGGFVSYLPNQDSNISGKYSMTFDNCVTRIEGGSAFAFCTRWSRGGARLWDGTLTVKNCTFENPGKHCISVAADMIDKVDGVFENCKLIGGGKSEKPYQGGKDSSGAAPVNVQYIHQDQETPEMTLAFNNLVIEDSRDIPWLTIADDAFCGADNYRITGNVKRTINGETKTFVVDKTYILQTFKDRKLRRVIRWSDTGKTYSPAKPDAPVELPRIASRHNGEFWVYATKGKPVEFSIKSRIVGKKESKGVPVKFTYPSGKIVEFAVLERGATLVCTIPEAEETGLCKVNVSSSGNGITLEKSATAAGIMLPAGKTSHLIYATGELFFNVADNQSAVAFAFKGEGQGEGVKVTLIAPDGSIFWERDDITDVCECDLGDTPTPGVWKIVFAKASHKHLEDFSVRPSGIAPYFTVMQEALPLPMKGK